MSPWVAAAEDVRQERDVLAQMVRTLQDREQASGRAWCDKVRETTETLSLT